MASETRPEPPMTGSERDQLNGFLDFLRSAVSLKARGLTDEQARRVHVPTSTHTTVAGLVGHLTYVESYWFSVVLGGQEDPWRERFKEDRDAEFTAAASVPIDELVEAYEAQCQTGREIAAKLELDQVITFGRKEREVTVRWVLLHMIEETGRHAGHLDLLRELTDGQTGE
ncbi:DinB family protein [Amycolatopsis albispora]|uniref:Mini-circle protein n=1 Tax=Amycolatopsis albispora TaxID=1804986 RepID=A0A344LKH8_9PSEU|nr:DinB family protein [Amycolatopsis albispora]AXB48552.1 mini-circle protein [Amycolatopsis albispora]